MVVAAAEVGAANDDVASVAGSASVA